MTVEDSPELRLGTNFGAREALGGLADGGWSASQAAGKTVVALGEFWPNDDRLSS